MKFNYNRNLVAIAALMFIGLFLLGCISKPLTPGANATNATIANPASVYCVNNGGVSKIVTAADGSQGGICVFPNGSQCDEWAYYRGECSPTNQTIIQAPPANISTLKESDFIVVDDSVPNLITSQEPVEAPEPG